MSIDLVTKIHLGLEKLDTVPRRALDSEVEHIETAAACAMLHSCYTEIQKILKLIAREMDARVPDSDAWYKELLNQVTAPTKTRPAVITCRTIASPGARYGRKGAAYSPSVSTTSRNAGLRPASPKIFSPIARESRF